MYPTVTLTANGNGALSATATPTVNVASDVSALVTASSSGLGYNRSTKLYTGTLTVKNTSGGALTSTGYFRVVLSGLSSKITLASASSGSPPPTFGYDAAADLYISLPLTQLAAVLRRSSVWRSVTRPARPSTTRSRPTPTSSAARRMPKWERAAPRRLAPRPLTPRPRSARPTASTTSSGRHRPDHRHRRCLRQPGHLPGRGRLRRPVRATASGPTLFQQYGPASSFLTVLNQDGRPDAAARRPTRPGPAPATGRWKRHWTWNGRTPSRPGPGSSWSRPTASRWPT